MEKTKKETIARYVTLAIVVAIIAFFGVLVSNPLRRSNETIRHQLEKITPLGTTLEDVTAAAKKCGWYSPGLYSSDSRLARNKITGDLGSYQGFFKTTVIAIWEFDSSNLLTNIQIWREQDAL